MMQRKKKHSRYSFNSSGVGCSGGMLIGRAGCTASGCVGFPNASTAKDGSNGGFSYDNSCSVRGTYPFDAMPADSRRSFRMAVGSGWKYCPGTTGFFSKLEVKSSEKRPSYIWLETSSLR